MGIKRRTCLGNKVLESAWLILLGAKHTHHEPLFFWSSDWKTTLWCRKKMAPPSVAACSLLSPGPSNSFIFHHNNLQMILTCSLPLYLTLVLVFNHFVFTSAYILWFSPELSSILETLSRNNCWVLGKHAHQWAEKYNYILWAWQRLASISGHKSQVEWVWILYIKLYSAFHGGEWTGNYLK